jgi:hypothetical protein
MFEYTSETYGWVNMCSQHPGLLKKDQYENSYTVVHDICYEKVVRKIQ